MSSVNTNNAAMVALRSLSSTNTQLEATQKRISTGLSVADAKDDGASFAVAERVRSDVGALTTANRQLGSAQSMVNVAGSSLSTISNTMKEAQKLLITISSSLTTQPDRNSAVDAYKNLVLQVANATDNSAANGQTLLGKTAGDTPAGTAVTAATSKTVVNNEVGATTTFRAADTSGLANTMATLIGSTFTRTGAGVDTFGAIAAGADQTAAATALTDKTTAASFAVAYNDVVTKQTQVAGDANLLAASVKFNETKIDSLNSGLGALIDADLSKESAMLQSLQIKQQLGTQALSLANQAPQALLSLFR